MTQKKRAAATFNAAADIQVVAETDSRVEQTFRK
jgi:hypothetical protein